MPGRKPPVPLADILSVLTDKNLKTRRDALNMLGKYKSYRQDPRVLPALIAATKDKTLTVVRAAMRTMSKIGDPRALDALLNVLKRPHSCSFERSIEKWVTSFGQASVPYLINTLGHPKAEARRRVLRLLDALKAPERYEVFIKALGDSDHTVQECAIYRLAVLGDVRAVQPLLKIMHSDEFDLPLSAAHAIGRLLGPAAGDHLLPMLRHRAAKVRQGAVRALQHSCATDPRVAPAIVEMLEDKNLDVRLATMGFLASHPYPQAKARLLELLADPEVAVRRIANVALRAYDVSALDVGGAMRRRIKFEMDLQTLQGLVYSLCEVLAEKDIPLLEAVIERRSAEMSDPAAPDHLLNMCRVILQKIRGEIEDLPREYGQVMFRAAVAAQNTGVQEATAQIEPQPA